MTAKQARTPTPQALAEQQRGQLYAEVQRLVADKAALVKGLIYMTPYRSSDSLHI